MKWPAAIRPGTVSNNLVMNIDIGQTFLAAANVKAPTSMQGESMLPLLQNKNPRQWRKSVYYHYYEAGDEHNVPKHVGVRNDRYKLIWFYENREWELYDLSKDKHEVNNLYNDKQYKKIQSELTKELIQLARKYKDEEIIELASLQAGER